MARKSREIRILPGGDPVAWFQVDGAFEMLVSTVDVTGEAFGQRRRVKHVIGLWLQFQSRLEMLLGVGKIARIDHRDSIVVVFFGGLKIDQGLFKPAIAHADVQLGIMGHFAVGPAAGLDEQVPGFGKFSPMEKADSLLEGL